MLVFLVQEILLILSKLVKCGYNKAIDPTAVASNLSALDHDYHLAGVTPSVIFQADISTSAKDSFEWHHMSNH